MRLLLGGNVSIAEKDSSCKVADFNEGGLKSQ